MAAPGRGSAASGRDAVTICVLRNGDTHTPPKRVVLSAKRLISMDMVIRAVGEAVPPLGGGGVRKLYDIRGKRVDGPGDLVPYLHYIACGLEPCKPLGKCAYAISDPALATADRGNAMGGALDGPRAVVVVQRARRAAPPAAVISVWVHRNGDEYSEPERVTVSRRLFPSLARLYAALDRVLRQVEGRVCALVELPSGRPVDSLAQLRDGRVYVAIAGGAAVVFRRVIYREPPSLVATLPAAEHLLASSHEFGSSARRNMAPKARNVLVFANGVTAHMGELVAVHRRSFRTLDALLAHLSDKLGLVSGVRRLVVLGGAVEIARIEDVVDGGVYVACGREPYRAVAYPVPESSADAGTRAHDGEQSGGLFDATRDGERFGYLDGAMSPDTRVLVVPERIERRSPPRTWTKH